MRFFLVNWILAILPPTRAFAIKRWLLNACGVEVGQNTKVCSGVRFYGAGSVKIGDDVWIGLHVKFITSLGSRIEVGNRCDVAPCSVFINGTHEIGRANRRAGLGKRDDIVVGDGTWVGANCCILGGAKIGKSSVVAASSLVRSGDYAVDILLAGVPASPKKKMTHET